MMAGIFSLLSTAALPCAMRVYPLLLPDSPTLPALTMQIVGSQVLNPGFNTRGVQKYRVQFDCWGSSYADASSLRDGLVTLLDGFKGTLTDGTNLQGSQLIQLLDLFEQDSLQYRLSAEFYLFAAF